MEREFQREKESAIPYSRFGEENNERMARMKQIAKTGRVLIKGKEVPYELGRQGHIRFYLHPLITDTALQPLGGPLLRMFTHDIRTYSGRHIHQGGVGLFVLNGRGYTTTNGVRNDWKEGDLIILPVMRGGVEHQHFNLDDRQPSRWLAIFTQMIDELLSYYRIQTAISPDWQGAAGEKEAVADDVLSQRASDAPLGTASSEKEAGTVWGALFKRRDEQREEVRNAETVV